MNKRLSWSMVVIALGFFIAFSIFTSVYGGDKPTVVTVETWAEESGEAALKGQISDTGRHEITQCGFKWGNSSSLEKEAICPNTQDANTSFSINIKDLQAGITYYYQAFALNSRGSAYGEVKKFTVPVDQRPTVTIISPTDDLSIVEGKIVKIVAEAEDDHQVESIKLFINGSLTKSAGSDKLTYDWDSSGVGTGQYKLQVKAEDGSKQQEEQEVTIVVKEKPPVVNLASKEPPAQPVINQSNSESINVSRSLVANTHKYPVLSKVKGSFGQFYYRDIYGGRIEIDPNWVAKNIVTITLPGLNTKVQVHKDAAGNFMTAFNYIKNGSTWINGREVPLLSLIHSMDGTWVPRHVGWSTSRGLSNHSWGTAIDINAQDHYRYVNPNTESQDPNLILWERAFKPAGFSWGNSYSDAMHFELLN